MPRTEPSADDDGRSMWNLLAKDHAARRWALARRVGYLEGVINSTLAALDAGIDGVVVAKVLREMLDSPEAPR